MLRAETLRMCARLFAPVPPVEIWRWNEQHTDFSLCQAYDTPRHAPYSIDMMPFWKEPLETLQDDLVSETWIVAVPRAGKSENLLLNSIRFYVGHKPCPVLYVTGDQTAAERFMDRRIKLGLQCNKVTAAKLTDSATVQHEHNLLFPDMELRVTWPRNKMAFKQDGWAVALGDEVDLWQGWKADQMRKRTETYPFGHIICVGSLDPDNPQPLDKHAIWSEFLQTDQRYWFMPDPVTGNMFRYEMGRTSTVYGLKWDPEAKKKDGTWDKDKVRRSAHYITPDGTRIDERERLTLVARGEWKATVPDAPSNKRGYHANAFYMPFSTTFGQIAVAFLSAREKGAAALRTFNYEYLSCDDLHVDVERISPVDVKAVLKRGTYHRGTIPTKAPMYVILVADAHKAWLGWQVWALGAYDVWLVDHGDCETLDSLDGIANGPYRDQAGKEYRCRGMFIDSGYRTKEVYRFCLARRNAMPIKGDTGATTRMDALVTFSDIERFPDGKPMPGKIRLAHIHPTEFRDELTLAIRPPKDIDAAEQPFRLWFHEDIDSVFCQQMSAKHPFDSEPNKQGKSYRYYKPVPDSAPDHHFDMGSYALAVRQMAWRDIAALTPDPETAAPVKVQASAPAPAPVPAGPACPKCKTGGMKRNGQLYTCARCGNAVYATDPAAREWAKIQKEIEEADSQP